MPWVPTFESWIECEYIIKGEPKPTTEQYCDEILENNAFVLVNGSYVLLPSKNNTATSCLWPEVVISDNGCAYYEQSDGGVDKTGVYVLKLLTGDKAYQTVVIKK